MTGTATTTGSSTGNQTTTRVLPIEEVSELTIADALARLIQLSGSKNEAPITRADIPLLILGVCVGNDREPKDTVTALRELTKLNNRSDEPLAASEIASLIAETRSMIEDYLEDRQELIKKRVEVKKEFERQKQQAARAITTNAVPAAPEIQHEADEIYASGKFMGYVQTQFLATWSGDSHVLVFVMAMFANGFIKNADEGLHLHLSGDSGTGKSESAKHALKFVPKDYTIIAQFSKKAPLYHSANYTPGSIVLNDDKTYSEEEIGLIRAMLAGWSEPMKYNTMDGTNPITVIIPPRISQIIPSVDGISQVESQGQNESRFCDIRISRSLEDMRAITDLVKKPGKTDERAIRVIMEIWGKITKEPVEITIPYIERIQIQDDALWKIREFKKFLTLIKSIAFLNGRTTANEDDFSQAQQMWTHLTLMQSNEITGLTKNEKIVYNHLKIGIKQYLSELKKECKLHEGSFYRAWYGKDGNFTHIKGGLLAKIPELHTESFHDKDTGLSDREVTLLSAHTFCVESPYTLKTEGS